MLYNHTIDYYSAVKRNKVLTYYTTWMNLEDMLNERSQIQKITYYRISLYEMSRIDEFTDAEGRLVVSRGLKEEKIGNDCFF